MYNKILKSVFLKMNFNRIRNIIQLRLLLFTNVLVTIITLSLNRVCIAKHAELVRFRRVNTSILRQGGVNCPYTNRRHIIMIMVTHRVLQTITMAIEL